MNRIGDFLKSRLTKGAGVRAIGVFILSLGTTLGVIYANYYNYWEETIYRTQTVDFNILSNLLSTKLSILLPNAISSKGSTSDLQQAIDSNYGLFGIIVTDCNVVDVSCPKQKILFASQSTVKHVENGRQKVIPRNDYARIWNQKFEESASLEQVLADSPYALLYNPPPLTQEWGFQSPREDKKAYFPKNQGVIIGRVYLLRGDRPSFLGELQKWLKDIPNSVLIDSAKTPISSRSLVYNSIVASTFITGLLVLFLMEFAYYLTRVAQENEARAVQEKLNTEQKLRDALNRAIKANQERQQSEDLARIAAEKSEQAIREKQEAESAACAINQQVIQEKLKAEEMARIAAAKSEQAIREKQEAEAAARAINQQVINEKEQARRNEIYLREIVELYEIEIKKATRELEEKAETLEQKIEALEREKYRLQSEIRSNTSKKGLLNEKNPISFELTENDFYDSERKDIILDILKNVNNIHDKSRRYHLWQDVIKNNASTGRREALKNEIQALFTGYRTMTVQIEKALDDMGFEIISEKNHYKIRFREDNRYVVTFSKTASDHRAGKNIATEICKLLL